MPKVLKFVLCVGQFQIVDNHHKIALQNYLIIRQFRFTDAMDLKEVRRPKAPKVID